MNLQRVLNHVFMAEAGVADAGVASGDGAATGADQSGTNGGNGAPPAGTTPEGGQGSVLASVAPPTHERFAEKYRTFKEDGSFDFEATALKSEEARSQLEKKLGNWTAPPNTPQEYVFDALPEGITAEEVLADPLTQGFLAKAHELGINNSQMQSLFNFAMTEWAPSLMDGNAAVSEQECRSALQKVWTSEEDFQANASASHRAVQNFATGGDGPGNVSRLMEKYGNDPDFIAFTANIGRELREDTSAQASVNLGGQTIQELMQSEAYTNPKHKDHAAVSLKVSKYYAARHPGIVE